VSGEQADFWVFGYGSLMWDPGFLADEAVPALVHGYHRRLCLYSYRYRGTAERPGLVFGLDRGGACRGMAFRIAGPAAESVRAYLWEREMPTGAYHPRQLRVSLGEARSVEALAFVVDTAHRQYAGRLDLDTVARLVATGSGTRGDNHAYLDSTIAHMRAIGLPDRGLERLALRVRALRAAELALPTSSADQSRA
jgi:cation transport protein ChaC